MLAALTPFRPNLPQALRNLGGFSVISGLPRGEYRRRLSGECHFDNHPDGGGVSIAAQTVSKSQSPSGLAAFAFR